MGIIESTVPGAGATRVIDPCAHCGVAEGVWCVAFSGDNYAFPFAKVSKQMERGSEDSIRSFFRARAFIRFFFAGRLLQTRWSGK